MCPTLLINMGTVVKKSRIVKLFFIFVFLLNKKTSPSPAFMQRPEIHAPKLKPPSKYTFVIATLAAQFGITPISDANNGAKYLLA